MQEIAAGNFTKVEAQYNSAMAAALPSGRLAQAWAQLTAKAGGFKSIVHTSAQQMQGWQVVTLVASFQRATLDAIVAFDPDGRIAGLRFVPHQEATEWAPPTYAHPSEFHERPVTITFLHWNLPGTLTVPNGTGPFPLLVLVQGSGPHDEDETIGPNKPFKDLAWGLASRGIAVLRYVKRTKQYGVKSSDDPQALTVNDEVIDDARAAVNLAAEQPEIDRNRICLLGHSLGGYLAPRIADGDAQIAGLIIMAGNTRPMEQIVVDQMRYLAAVSGLPADQANAQIAKAENDAKAIESPALAKGQTVELAGTRAPASYFLDLRDYHPAKVAAHLKIPILVLQGGRDYQVTRADYDGWKQALAGHSNATFKFYPALTHLFTTSSMPGTGLAAPQDYAKPGHVEQQVIQDVASWMESPRKHGAGNP
ncbi:MAG TPA: alpha/beta fold hydrolase [Candidatus Acidoferrales bacterium]|nr:alpha/beta fold hydrolase [Candidatus Acidoferrales bacterium]